MSFPTSAGATVEVRAVDRSTAPYRWTCSAGHDGGHAYASLPFCRDDARAHAEACGALPLVVVDAVTVYESAALRAAELGAKAATGVDLPALDVRSWEFAEGLMAGARVTLAAAGMLHLIDGVL
jgi:hypothetical protein